MKVEFVPINLIDNYEKNSNIHPPEQIHQIKALMHFKRSGDRYGLISGHGRKDAALEIYGEGGQIKMADGTPVPQGTMPVVFADNWSPEQITAYVMADNQVARNSHNDEQILAEELASLREVDFDLDLLGFDADELGDIFADFDSNDNNGEGSGEGGDDSRSKLLEMVNTTIAEPKNQLATKTIYRIGPHYLFTFSPISDWQVWSPYLEHEGDLFCPFAGPYVAITEKAESNRLIIVQPDLYIAGHTADRYQDIHPDHKITIEAPR